MPVLNDTRPASNSVPSGRGNPETNPDNDRFLKSEGQLVAFLNSPECTKILSTGVTIGGEDQRSKRIHQIREDTINYVTNRRDDNWRFLVQCVPETIAESAAKLASKGLRPNQVTGEAFITPRKVFDKDPQSERKTFKGYVAVPIPGVRGVERLLLSSGEVLGLRARAVYAQDELHCTLGTREEIIHRPNIKPVATIPNTIVAAYTVINLKNGQQHVNLRRIQSSELGGARMTPDSQARYLSQRPCMREVIQTHLENCPALMALVEMEDAAYQVGEDAIESIRSSTKAEAGPVIKTAKPDLASPMPKSLSTGEPTQTKEIIPPALAPEPLNPAAAPDATNNAVAGQNKTQQPLTNSENPVNPADAILNERKTNLATPPQRTRRL